VDIDLDQGRLALAQTVWAAARTLTWNPVQIARAADTAWGAHRAARKRPAAGGTCIHPSSDGSHALRLAVVGHPYLLRDEFVNQRLLYRLERLGARVLTPDMLPDGAAERGAREVTGAAYWAYAAAVTGAGFCFLDGGRIDGLVAVIAFGCAPDSGMAPELARLAKERRIPMLTLTLDEHSGEAGLVTRLEAFVDMLERKRLSR
jgi:predicted nucleotide-binding protein (sugar kinase/HSP70/actin superfamily)